MNKSHSILLRLIYVKLINELINSFIQLIHVKLTVNVDAYMYI